LEGRFGTKSECSSAYYPLIGEGKRGVACYIRAGWSILLFANFISPVQMDKENLELERQLAEEVELRDAVCVEIEETLDKVDSVRHQWFIFCLLLTSRIALR
jgi:hypothetical protein